MYMILDAGAVTGTGWTVGDESVSVSFSSSGERGVEVVGTGVAASLGAAADGNAD